MAAYLKVTKYCFCDLSTQEVSLSVPLFRSDLSTFHLLSTNIHFPWVVCICSTLVGFKRLSMRLGKAAVMDKQQKYCIVTGANAGIGKEITAGLMQEPGSHVVMACRNMQQCELAKAELKARGLPGTCECSRCVSLQRQPRCNPSVRG
jgi:hypothetical protein